MKKPGKYHKRILCPGCEGEGTQMLPNEKEELEDQTCELCGGKRAVKMIVTIEYEKLK